jgi:hypothetical protein
MEMACTGVRSATLRKLSVAFCRDHIGGLRRLRSGLLSCTHDRHVIVLERDCCPRGPLWLKRTRCLPCGSPSTTRSG